jgi:Pyruvate/2-oxoacid:ferredoxin oxidoreductase delta subunit
MPVASEKRKVDVPVLFNGVADCCGCESCLAACPKSAISMHENRNGFAFPEIDESLCVGCHACIRACGLHQRVGRQTQGSWYAAAGTGDVSRSASAGAFVTLAREVVAQSGVVFGAAYRQEADGLYVRHQMAETDEGLVPLQNSKYVQSDAGPCFPEVRERLRAGYPVLFCGTPCQVAGLRAYLGKHDWPNLYTVDLVCHGVPSQQMFRDWVRSLEERYGGRVTDVCFRSKRDGWAHSLLLLLQLDGHEEPVYVPSEWSDYYGMFLGLETLRDSCYKCPYASDFRAGDLTLGDFWGVQVNAPEVLDDSERFDMRRGVSCLLVNDAHGREALERFGGRLALREVNFDAIANGNDQLRHPSVMPVDRDACLGAYRNGGWDGVSRWWRWHHVVPAKVESGIKGVAKKVLPKSVVDGLKRLRGRK